MVNFFLGRYTNELKDIRMICGSDFFWRGKYTNELEDIRMNLGSDFFLEGVRMNWKIYE